MRYLYGTNDGNDLLQASNHNTAIFGGGGSDTLAGGSGNDHLYGGSGNNVEFGGAGSNVFYFDNDSVGYTQTVGDFTASDRLNFNGLDANVHEDGVQHFHLSSDGTLNAGHAGEATIGYNSVTHIETLQGDVDGDGQADFTVLLHTDHLYIPHSWAV